MADVRALTPADAAAYFELRQEMLADAPWAFLSSPEDDFGRSAPEIAAKLGERENAILGAWDDGALVASAGLIREQKRKVRHRAWIWGVYTTPPARGRGVSRAVVGAAVDLARSWPGVELVTLSASSASEAAMRVYESLGFERWGREPDYVRLDGVSYDEIHYHKRL